MSETSVALETRQQVLHQIRLGARFAVVTHENLDGDALGSLVAMHAVLRSLGKDAVMVIAPEEFPLPPEYRFFALEGLLTEVPQDLDERTAIFLDCGNLDRNPLAALREAEPLLNIDHHHDNTRFGTVNHIVEDASCTAEIVWDLMPSLGVALTPAIAEALYVGLVTDTGRFSYENTTPRCHRMAAELLEAGVDAASIYSQIYEGVPFAKLELLSHALASSRCYDDGRLIVAVLSREDFSSTAAQDSYSEGIVDHLRAVRGAKVAALIREMGSGCHSGERKVSLRASDDEVDVSAIARSFGGGGHRRAAGFSSELSTAELIDAIRALV
ncbi:MAG TPA: bifunctional oligoribonuclease/PAP phosphatase NrnA [Solirubrobacteraceae bacterium]|nr:bifunctional oligoribonuclease/PAP phosphatase NrnA [Solirubrobacteraceae bacterium]